ncbi:hypothetical protein Tco_1176722 [Tanacetum coccineum]
MGQESTKKPSMKLAHPVPSEKVPASVNEGCRATVSANETLKPILQNRSEFVQIIKKTSPSTTVGNTKQTPVCLEVKLEPDEWIKDSGCTRHMTGNKDLFSTYEAINGGNVVKCKYVTRNMGKGPKNEENTDSYETLWHNPYDSVTPQPIQAFSRENQALGLVKPEIRGNVNFEIKSPFIRKLREDTFFGNKNKDAHDHVDRVLNIVCLFNILGVSQEAVLLRVFSFTLTESAKRWVDRLTLGSVNTWDLLKKAFIQSNSNTDGLAAFVSKLDNLGRDMKKLKENILAIQVGCQICEGPHLDKECPLKEDVKHVEEVKTTNGAPSSSTGQCKVVNVDHETLNIPISSRKKGHMLDKIWEYCKDVHRNSTHWWHNHGFEEEERNEMGIEIEKYDPPKVQVETFKVRKYSFKGGQKFDCVTKKWMPPSGLKGLLPAKCNRDSYESELGENELAQDEDFLDFSTGLIHCICLEAKLKGVSCSNPTLPVYFISLMYNRDIVQNKWEDDRQEQQVKKKLRLDEYILVKHFGKPIVQTYNGKKALLKSWVIDYFEEALDPDKDPMERSFDDYKWVFDLEIEQLANEYELGIGKKGQILDMIWENCKNIQGKAEVWWYDYWLEEDEKQENGDKKYDPPMVHMETFEITRYSFDNGNSFICVTEEIKDTLSLGRENGSRFRKMIRQEMNQREDTHDKT